MDEGLQLSLDLIVGQEGLVARVSDCQGIPVLEQGGPGLEQSTHTQSTAYLDSGSSHLDH